MPWLIVKFIETDEVEALPENWYNETKGIVLYPSFPRGQLEKAIKNKMEPDKTWTSYKVRLLRSQPYDNFKIACSKASKACITSDISDLEAVLPTKRISKKKYISSDEEDFSSDESLKNVPHPPSPFKKSGLTRTETRTKSNGNAIIESRSARSSVRLSPSDGEHNADNTEDDDDGTSHIGKYDDLYDKRDGHSDIPVQGINRPTCVDEANFKKQVVTYLVKQNKILKDLETKCENLSRTLDDTKVVMQSILDAISSKGQEGINAATPNDVFKKCPVKTLLELEEFEEDLKDESTYTLLVKNLSRLGGNNFKECTRRFLTKLVNDQTAQMYSQHGHKGKKSFSKLTMFSVVSDAVQLCDQKVTKKEIENASAQWLAKASVRLKAKNQNDDNQANDE